MRCSSRCASSSLPCALQKLQPIVQLIANLIDRTDRAIFRRDVMCRREHREARHLAADLARERIEQRQRFDFVVEQLDAQRLALGFRRENIDDIATHAISALRQIHLVALVLHVRETAQHLALIHAIAARQMQHHLQIRLGIAQAVNCGHGRDDDRVGSLEQRLGRRQAHLLDVLVDRRILLDIRVRRRHVRLGLVVVVIRNEVLDGVVGKELLELAVQLRG